MSLTPLQFWTHTTLAIVCFSIPGIASQPVATEPYADQAVVEKYEETRRHMRKFGSESAPPKQNGAFRLTTYNIENLFDANDDPTLTGRDEDIDDTKPEHQLIATAMAIHAINPDVITFQEIESEQALLEYRDNYLSDMGYDYIVSIDAGNSRGIENAILSRFPISHYENWPNKPLGGVHPERYGDSKNWYAGEPIAFRRSPLRVDLQIPTTDPTSTGESTWTLTLFIMHHKSGRYNTYWREAEATGTLKLINTVIEEDPNRPIVILGDFNAEPNATSVQTYLKAGFVDIFEDHTKNDQIPTHESGRRIDLILANQPALDHMDTENAFVFGTAARPEGTSWRDLDSFEGYASDHYPVSVDLTK